ncbi:coiled-coil domain-containing protein 57-like isoform X2 [Styela clava]
MNSVKLKEIGDLANKKEKEWKHLTSLQLSSLQTAMVQKANEHKELCGKFTKLKEDFKYNLKLLHDRDKELKTYDESFTKTKTLEVSHMAAISDLKIKIANLAESLEREQQTRCEMQRHYRQRLIDKQAELEAFKSTKDAEVEETLSQMAQMNSQHERFESQLRSEIIALKFEFTSELDNALLKKEKENRENDDKFQAETLSHQLKCKVLEKELELVKSTHVKQSENLLEADEACSKLKKKLQKAEHDVKDISSIKNSRILELEAKVQNLESKNASINKDYEHRRQQLDEDIRLKQSNMEVVRQNFLKKEKSLKEEICKLRSKAENSEQETNRALWDKNDLVKENQVIVENLKRIIQDLTLRFENQVKIHNSSAVSKDVEIRNFHKKEIIMKTEIEKQKNYIEKLKQDLASSTQKENLLLQSKVQLKMDWQQRCQEIKRKQSAGCEGLIQSLTKSRDNAFAEVRKLRQKLGMEIEDDELDDKNFEELEKQNNRLKTIIEQMTNDMQKLAASQSLNSTMEVNKQHTGPQSISVEYVKSLEKELRNLKKEKRDLLETEVPNGFVTNLLPSVTSNSSVSPVITASFVHPDLNLHINSLNKKIGNLRAEKTELSVQLEKLKVRLHHQELILNSRENESKQQLVRIQELEYDLSSNQRRYEQEAQFLKRQISDIVLQLEETRKESDEYDRGGIQNNLHVTELGSHLSQMKVAVASKSPWMGEIAQAGIVQQLKSEITDLRRKLAKAKQALILGNNSGKPTKATILNKQLYAKLQLAAKQISRLLQEKSQLLEIGNSLRSELASKQMKNGKILPTNDGDAGDGVKFQNKLKEIENLQYQLTRQELRYAQGVVISNKPKIPDTPPSTSTPEGDASLKDVWKMLDQEPSSPSAPGSQDDSGITDKKVASQQTQSKPVLKKWSTSEPAENKNRRSKTAKIRNYNIQDDEFAELQSKRS